MTRTFTHFAFTAIFAILWSYHVRGADLTFFEDATLRSLQMIDEHEGWAVGDQGTVWHTMDGGTNWERQPTGTRATLTDVHMLDFRSGWIAARESVPYAPGSAGQLLWTRDGGGRWHLTSRQDMSGLREIQFPSENQGFAVGESTDQHPSGIFHTEDGGRRWTPWRGLRFPGWTTALFLDVNRGLLGGYGGTFANYQQGVVLSARCDWRPGTSVHKIIAGADRIWAVGDQAQVFQSLDQGKSWLRVETNVPDDVARVWNFHSITTAGQKVWIAGRPGSVVLHSPDGGESWSAQETPSKVPLHDIAFTDEVHGWAVGDFGTILATRDGGKSWEIQRQSGCEAAILWLSENGDSVPLTTVARHGGEDGYHNVALAIGSADLKEDLPSLASRHARFTEGFRAAGGTATDRSSQFRTPSSLNHASSDAILAWWNQLHEGKASSELEREIVLAIRMWCPRVLVAGSDDERPGARSEEFVVTAAQAAFRAAADPTKYPEQIQFLKLKEFAPRSIYRREAASDAATVRLHAGDFAPHLLESYQDAAEVGRALMAETYAPIESAAYFTLLEATFEKPPRGTTLLAGAEAAPGSPCRRLLDPIDEAALTNAEKQSQKKTTLLAIASSPSRLVTPEALLASLHEATEELTLDQAGQTIFQIGRQHVEHGRWELARAVFQELLESQPQHPLALEAYRWLIGYYASSEALLRTAKPAVFQSQQTSFTRSSNDAPTTIATEQQQHVTQRPEYKKESCGMAILMGSRLYVASPHLWADPRLQLCLYSAYRRIGNTQVLDSHWHTIVDSNPKTRWAAAIELEKWLINPSDIPPRNFVESRHVGGKPYLDGQIEEAAWKGIKPVVLQGPTESQDLTHRTEILIGHDHEHLYLAARCAVPPEVQIPSSMKRTEHDADLRDQDRLEILIDLDRDYTSYYRLSVDQRGLVAADCWGDRTWNPRWFVAREADEKGWRIEAAIPLAELTDVNDLTEEIWAFNVVRIVPNHGALGISLPAAEETRPEGFTLIRFQRPSEQRIGPAQAN